MSFLVPFSSRFYRYFNTFLRFLPFFFYFLSSFFPFSYPVFSFFSVLAFTFTIDPAYDSKYKKKFYKSFAFRFNLKEDKATMDHLENQADKTNYIKIPILSDIDKQKNKFF